jgi:hypothetical protein
VLPEPQGIGQHMSGTLFVVVFLLVWWGRVFFVDVGFDVF